MRRATLIAALLLALAVPAAPAAAPDGRYAGKLKNSSSKVKLRIAKDGRQLRKLRATMVAYCIGATFGDNRIAILLAYVPKAKIKKNGRFKGKYEPAKAPNTEIEYEGVRRGNRVRGKIKLRVSNCFATREFSAKRVGR